jgi:acetylornithine deacetylase
LTLTIDRDYLTRTLTDLVAINSINLSLVPSGPGEAEIAAYMAQAMRDLGLDVALHEAQPSRISTVGILRGHGQGRSLMLNGHTDTVGVEGMANPFAAEIRNGKMYGRGAYDMKGSLAACLAAVKALVDSGSSLPGDVMVAAVADEEYGSLGTADVIKQYQVDGAIVTEPTQMNICLAHKGVDGAIVTEPTQMNICLAHKGFTWLEVETTGRAAHGSRFEDGIDAVMRMGRFLAELDQLEQELRTRPAHELLGPPSLHASMIEGGTELSVYAAQCSLKIERRTIPGESQAQVVGEVQAMIDRLAAADPTFQATVKPFFQRDPFEVSPDAEIVRAVEQAAVQAVGHRPPHTGATYWADAALLAAAGVETVMIGPIGAGLHAVEEWVELQSLVDLAHILAETARIYCQGGKNHT